MRISFECERIFPLLLVVQSPTFYEGEIANEKISRRYVKRILGKRAVCVFNNGYLQIARQSRRITWKKIPPCNLNLLPHKIDEIYRLLLFIGFIAARFFLLSQSDSSWAINWERKEYTENGVKLWIHTYEPYAMRWHFHQYIILHLVTSFQLPYERNKKFRRASRPRNETNKFLSNGKRLNQIHKCSHPFRLVAFGFSFSLSLSFSPFRCHVLRMGLDDALGVC